MNTQQLILKPISFVKRDFLIAAIYRLSFVMQTVGIFISALMFFFLSRLIGKGVQDHLTPYGGDYFSFVLIGTTSGLLGGILYPVSVLPAWLQPYAYLFPITHAPEAIRQILLNGATFEMVYDKALIPSFYTAILIPSGLIAFAYGLKIAKREGSLVHY